MLFIKPLFQERFFYFVGGLDGIVNINERERDTLQLTSTIREKRRKEKVNCILNHRVDGESFIATSGRIWKAIVLRHFNQVYRGELTVDELVDILEKRYGVKYVQKRSLVKYPIQETLKYIAKISKIELKLPP